MADETRALAWVCPAKLYQKAVAHTQWMHALVHLHIRMHYTTAAVTSSGIIEYSHYGRGLDNNYLTSLPPDSFAGLSSLLDL